MAIPNVVERLSPGELLVPGSEVDLRVPRWPPAVVEIAAVDVDPGAVEPIDDLAKAAEVDGDQVVHRHARQRLDRVQGALRPAVGVGVGDLVEEPRSPRAPDLDAHVARERQERDRVRGRIGANQHQRVRAPRGVVAVLLAVVVADHERDRRLSWECNCKLSRGALYRRRVGRDGRDRLMEVQIRTSRSTADQNERCDTEPQRDAADQRRARSWWPRGLPVDVDGRQGTGRKNGRPVSVWRGPAPQASLQSRSHRTANERLHGRPSSEDSSATGLLRASCGSHYAPKP